VGVVAVGEGACKRGREGEGGGEEVLMDRWTLSNVSLPLHVPFKGTTIMNSRYLAKEKVA